MLDSVATLPAYPLCPSSGDYSAISKFIERKMKLPVKGPLSCRAAI